MSTITEYRDPHHKFIPRPKYSDLVLALPVGARLNLTDVSWQEYEDLLVDLDENPQVRLTYDHGDLDIMTLSPEHEGYSRLFTHLVQILTEATATDFIALGSTTLKDRLVESGVEADDCFYIGDFTEVAEKKRLDLSTDPAPDLAVEIDITSHSLHKLPLYALLQIKELWRFDGQQMQFYRLTGNQYLEITHSERFTFLTPDVLPAFLIQGKTRGINAMRRAFRDWVEQNRNQ